MMKSVITSWVIKLEAVIKPRVAKMPSKNKSQMPFTLQGMKTKIYSSNLTRLSTTTRW